MSGSGSTLAQRPTEKDAQSGPEKDEQTPNILARLPVSERTRNVLEWFLVTFGIYVLITAVGWIGDGFSAATGGRAEELFSVAENPFVGLAIGILATVLTQSSSTTASIVVGMVAGGLPLGTAILILMGANIGTTMTAIIAAFGFSGIERTAGMTAATVHLLYNVFAMAVIMGILLLRPIPVKAAAWLGNLGAENTLYVVIWVLGVFVAIPGVMILLTSVF
ncbi:Na/Pi cotransporter family protein [Kocuria marina]|uniref:Na/Pi cotransporter family protein n=2 Tax=Micrococcaceae TaxID=1268 RepID=UPI0018751B57|nr:Na/Pi cotransporter family protein [Kocuria marina]MCT1723959.1 hypothetical protein [Kocuria marina]MCT1735913.1 hypothetical protein [Kocuria marina]GHD84635.1 hypothetical protein GCM10007061_02990 [Kocuria marina]